MLQKSIFLFLFLHLSILAISQTDTGMKLGNHLDDVESVAVAPNDFYVATGSWDNTVQIFTGDSTFTHFQSLAGHNAAVSAIGFSGHGEMLVTGGRDYKLMIWSKLGKQKFELIKELSMVHTAGINSVFVGPYGNMIYSAGYDGKIVVHNMRKESKRIIDNKTPINEIALSTTRQFIYCADESPIVKMYDGVGNKIRELKGHKDVVNAVACNGEYILTGSSDRTAIVWDVLRGKPQLVLDGHRWKVTSVSISADGKYAITGSIDGTTKIWDIKTGEEVRTYSEENGIVRQVSMSRNMKYVFTAHHMDSTLNYTSYGASVWKSGLEYEVKPAVHPELVKYMERKRAQDAKARNSGYSGRSTQRGSGNTSQRGKQPAKPIAEDSNKEVITKTDEIQITIEDE